VGAVRVASQHSYLSEIVKVLDAVSPEVWVVAVIVIVLVVLS